MLKPGYIVTDLDPDSVFEGEQGEVMVVQLCLWDPPEVLVRFDRDLKDKLFSRGYEDFPDGILEVYREDELRRDDDWTLERYARRHFGKNWHHANMLPRPLNTRDLCMVANCGHNQSQVVWVNIWGTVLNVYLCPDHARYYQKYCYLESFPWRKTPEVSSAA